MSTFHAIALGASVNDQIPSGDFKRNEGETTAEMIKPLHLAIQCRLEMLKQAKLLLSNNPEEDEARMSWYTLCLVETSFNFFVWLWC